MQIYLVDFREDKNGRIATIDSYQYYYKTTAKYCRMPDVSPVYHCCADCQGLLNNAAALQLHRAVCTGAVRDTEVPLYACTRSRYVLLQKYSEKEIIFLLHHHLLVTILDECQGATLSGKRKEKCGTQHTTCNLSEGTPERAMCKKIKRKVLDKRSGAKQKVEPHLREGSDDTSSVRVNNEMEENRHHVGRDNTDTVPGPHPESHYPDINKYSHLENLPDHIDRPDNEESLLASKNSTSCNLGREQVNIAEHIALETPATEASNLSANEDPCMLMHTESDHISGFNDEMFALEADGSSGNGQASLGPVLTAAASGSGEGAMSADMKMSVAASTDTSSKLPVDASADLETLYHRYRTDDNTYNCPHCPAAISSSGFFHRHMTIKHGRALLCDHCGVTFPNKTQLLLHQNKHTRPFSCSHCGRGFARRIDMDRHVMIHDGKYPFVCKVCDYKCRTHRSMSAHMRKHEGNLLQCPSTGCDFVTNHPWTLKQHHMAKHESCKRFQCDQCGYVTSDSSSFRLHQMRHQGIKNYQCSECSFRAHTRHDVIRHMRRHTGEKGYQCNRCSFSTSHRYALQRHVMSHLGVKPWRCSNCGYEHSTRSKVVTHVAEQHPGAQVISMSQHVKLDGSYLKKGTGDDRAKQDFQYTVPVYEQKVILDMVAEHKLCSVEGSDTGADTPAVMAGEEAPQTVVVAEDSEVLLLVTMDAGSGEEIVSMGTEDTDLGAMSLSGVPEGPVTVETVYHHDA